MNLERKRNFACSAGIVALLLFSSGCSQEKEKPVTPEALVETKVSNETVRLRLITDAGSVCVGLDFQSDTGFHPPACLKGKPLAIGATIRGGKTLVYGLSSQPVRLLPEVEEAPTPELQQVPLAQGAAFLLVADKPNASGKIKAIDDAGRILAEASFDRGGPARAPKSTIGSAEILLAYRSEGAVWAITTHGNTVRLSEGTLNAPDGAPSVAPDGQTVLHGITSFEGIFDKVVALDARAGTSRPIGVVWGTFSNQGHLAAGVIPVDDDVDIEVILRAVPSFEEVARVSIGIASEVGGLRDLGWNIGDRELLAVGAEDGDLWGLEPFVPRATRLASNGERKATWVIGEQALRPGVFPAVRREGSSADWGLLKVSAGTASFERLGSLPVRTPQAKLEAEKVSFLDRLPRKLVRDRNGKLSASDSSEVAYLIGDGRNLFQLSADGDLTFLLSNVDAASAP